MVSLPLDNDSPLKNLDKRKTAFVATGVVALLVILIATPFVSILRILFTSTHNDALCPLADIVAPKLYKIDNLTLDTIVHDKKFRLQSVQRLAGAVKVDTQVTDNQPDVDDAPEVWSKFGNFHKYLKKTFPLVHENLELDKVNTYGLVYTWKGSSSKLKPLVLTAHQDTVPVQKDTLDKWDYDPFSGHYDGHYVYGRGASDCKNVLIAILESFELLLRDGFQPTRSVIAAFGFDEEASGVRGALSLGKYLEKVYGHNGIYAIVDEGPGLFKNPLSDTIVATVATGEKGYVDLKVELKMQGGHSLIPPDHTSIGIISELNYNIEADQYSPFLSSENPMLSYLQCIASNDYKNKIGSVTKKSILSAEHNNYAKSKIIKALASNPFTKYFITTSQSIDIFRGGEKANALPESASIVVNHRISVEKTVDEIKSHFTNRVLELAHKHNLAVEAFGEDAYTPKDPKGTLVVSSFSAPLESAPVSPFGDAVWNELAGVTRHIFEEAIWPEAEYPILTAPALMPANTDTRYYWNLTKHIFRYTPAYIEDLTSLNIHSVNERLPFDAHLHTLAFFYEYVQKVSETK